MNEELAYAITPKGRAFLAYIEAQEAAADTGDALGFEEQLDYFEHAIYAPIKKHVATEMVKDMVEGTMEEVCEDPELPSFEELDEVARTIGAAFLDTYAALASQEAQDA